MGVDQSPKNLGIRLSQPYVDVDTAEDKDLIFSSSFPMLKEEATGVFNINGTSGTNILVHEHKLNYHPFFVVLDDQGKMRLGSEWSVDTNGFYFSGSATFPPRGSTGNFRWTVYRLPLFDSFKAFSNKAQTTKFSEYSPDYGLKAVKEGKNIDSADLRDFTIHSRGRSPLVHEINVKSDWSSANASHIVTPNLPYRPMFFAYALSRLDNKTFPIQSYGQSFPFVSEAPDGSITIFSNSSATTKSSIVVFKDPFLSPVTKDIRY